MAASAARQFVTSACELPAKPPATLPQRRSALQARTPSVGSAPLCDIQGMDVYAEECIVATP